MLSDWNIYYKDEVGTGVWHIESPRKAPGWFILERVSCLVHTSGLLVSSRVVCPTESLVDGSCSFVSPLCSL